MFHPISYVSLQQYNMTCGCISCFSISLLFLVLLRLKFIHHVSHTRLKQICDSSLLLWSSVVNEAAGSTPLDGPNLPGIDLMTAYGCSSVKETFWEAAFPARRLAIMMFTSACSASERIRDCTQVHSISGFRTYSRVPKLPTPNAAIV